MPLTPLTPAVGKGKAGKAGSWYLDFFWFHSEFHSFHFKLTSRLQLQDFNFKTIISWSIDWYWQNQICRACRGFFDEMH